MRVVEATVKAGILRRSITLADSQRTQTISLPIQLPFFSRRVDLWSRNAERDFVSAFGNSGIAGELNNRMLNLPGPLMLRVQADEGDHVPWEAFQRGVDPSNWCKFGVIRTTDADRAFRLDKVASPLQVLALVGHPDVEPAFDPGAAVSFLEEVLTEAGAANRRLGQFVVKQVLSENLAELATETRALAPNVFIFFGHGEHSPPRIRLAGGDSGWMALGEFVDRLFPEPLIRPVFWIFWACSLAENTDQPRLHLDSPDVLHVLGDRGGVAVLAMRSRIQVKTARVMLEALVAAVAAGEPLEVAAALARAAAIHAATEYPESCGRLDYAAPAVWSRSEPVERVTWGAEEAFPASWVALPLIAAGNEFPEFATGLAQVDDAAIALAKTWATPGRYFVASDNGSAPVEDAAARARLFGAAAIIRKTTGRPVVPILLQGGTTFDHRIALWAENAHGYLDPRFHDRELAMAIGAVGRERLNGLVRLLAIPGIVVILSEPPDRSTAWEVLANAPSDCSIVVLGQSPPEEISNWVMETLMLQPFEQRLCDLIKDEPLGCAVLCVIERPLALRDVERLVGTTAGALDPLDPLLVRVGGRRVLTETIRRKVQEQVSRQTIAEARRICIALLLERPVGHDFDATVEVCRQYLALGEEAAAAEVINAAWEAAGTIWSVQQRVRLFTLMTRNSELCGGLRDEVLVAMVEAGINVQETSIARMILEAFHPRSLTHSMRRHAMLAECFKADAGRPGSTAAMWLHAEQAIVCAEKAALGEGMNEVGVITCRHNLARLRQYFDHDYDQAIPLYQRILELLRARIHVDKEYAHLFAAASRNAAECILDPAPRPIVTEIRDRAEEFVMDGLQAARAQSLCEVEAELMYTKARIAEAANDYALAAQLLAELAGGPVARAYPLIATIAVDRLSWNELRRGLRPLAWEDLQARLRALDLFDHAWAVRVAIKSRLRGAKQLAQRGRAIDLQQARQLLEGNRQQFKRLRYLSGREDVQGAAATFAGIQVLSSGEVPAWDEFLADPRAAHLPEGWKGRTVREIWEG